MFRTGVYAHLQGLFQSEPVSAYLLKPIRQSELREAIAKVLGAREQEGMIPLVTRYSLGDARDRSEILRILVAEDNLVNQRLVVRLLGKGGIEWSWPLTAKRPWPRWKKRALTSS
jgi:CheY-like chemotaxis protein